MDDARLKKLKYRAWHRGFREADLIFGPFADNHVASLSPEDLDRFERLIDEPDQTLYAWIVGREPTPPEHDHALMDWIKQFRFEAHTVRGDNKGA